MERFNTSGLTLKSVAHSIGGFPRYPDVEAAKVMSTTITQPSGIIYPDSDGQPMAENTLQFKWIVLIKEGLETLFHRDPNVFVAGDLLWYPVEGQPKIRQAPDVLVAIGRPKGERGSYMQWEEEGIAPQVVFEVLSPGNRFNEMLASSGFMSSMESRNTTSTTRIAAIWKAGSGKIKASRKSLR